MLSSVQLVRHFTRQAVVVKVSDKNSSKAPEIIAPIKLVAAKDIARRITDVKIVPKIPVSRVGIIPHTQFCSPLRTNGAVMSVNPR